MNSPHSLSINLYSSFQSLFRGSLPQRHKVTPRVEGFYFPTTENTQPHSLQTTQNAEQ